MALTKQQKNKVLEDLKEKMEKQKSIVFLDIQGIKVKDLTKLRKLMKEKECELRVAKKTLIAKTLKDQKVNFEAKKMSGEIALGFGFQDEISPFKTSYDFSKETENLKILGGLFENEIIEKEKALVLASLPSKEVLLAKLVGSLQSPVSGLLNVMQGNIRNFVYLLNAIKGRQS